MPPNLPLPAKIVMQVLPPIDIVAEFGEKPDIDEVDAHVRHVMQEALTNSPGTVAYRCWGEPAAAK